MTVIPDCYDQKRNPGAPALFSADAIDLLAMVAAYLDLLDGSTAHRCSSPLEARVGSTTATTEGVNWPNPR